MTERPVIERHVHAHMVSLPSGVMHGVLQYDVNDPLAVTMLLYPRVYSPLWSTFVVDWPAIRRDVVPKTWRFARSIMRDGLVSVVGVGDVRAWPMTMTDTDGNPRKFVMFSLTGFDDNGSEINTVIALRRDVTSRFVLRMFTLVPTYAETTLLGPVIDSGLALILDEQR